MLTDLQARASLKGLIEKHLSKNHPDFEHLIDLIQDHSRQIPIRGVLEDIRSSNNAQFTQQELELIVDLLYMYG